MAKTGSLIHSRDVLGVYEMSEAGEVGVDAVDGW